MERNKSDIKLSVELLENSIQSLLTAEDSYQRESNHAAIKASHQLLRSRVDEFLSEITVSMEGMRSDDKSMGEAEDRSVEERRNFGERRNLRPRRSLGGRESANGPQISGKCRGVEKHEVETQEAKPIRKKEELEINMRDIRPAKKKQDLEENNIVQRNNPAKKEYIIIDDEYVEDGGAEN